MTVPDLLAGVAYYAVYGDATNFTVPSPHISLPARLAASCLGPLLLHVQFSALETWLGPEGEILSRWLQHRFVPTEMEHIVDHAAWLNEHCAADLQVALDQQQLAIDDLIPLLDRAQALSAALAGMRSQVIERLDFLHRLTQDLARMTFRNTHLREGLLRDCAQQASLLANEIGRIDTNLSIDERQAGGHRAQARLSDDAFVTASQPGMSNGQTIINIAPNQGIQGIVNGPVTLQYTPSPSHPAIHQLRAPVGDFIGRTRELDQLYQIVSPAAERGNTAALVGICGLGGIGKTELAYAVAQRLCPLFVDGQIVVHLRGAGGYPLSTRHALQQIIHAFLPDEKLPDDLDELIGRYRSILAGKHVLILADDARDAAHVRALIPPPGCALLVTSRGRFVLPGMVLLSLETLAPDHAAGLLVNICQRIQDAAPQIAELCGYLPLALRVSASLLARYDHKPIAQYVDQLRVVRQRLALLRDPDDPELDVLATLQLSYDQLTAGSQTALRWLSVFSTSFETGAAQAILAQMVEHARYDALDELRKHSLLEFDPLSERYNLHDLVRVFADDYLAETERTQVQQRYFAHYLDIVEQASPHLIGSDQGYWIQCIEQEHAHIRVVLKLSSDQHDIPSLLRLTGALWRFWESRGYLQEGQTWLDLAIAQARIGTLATPAQKHSYAESLTGAGALAQTRGRYDVARQFFLESLAVWEQIGDRLGRARAQNNLGHAMMHQGEYLAAEHCFSESLELRRELDDGWGAAVVLCNMGVLAQDQGEHVRAIQLLEQGITELSALEDAGSVAMYRDNLGHSLRALGDLPGARALFQDSLAHRRAAGDRWGEASALESLGQVALAEGDLQQAGTHLKACLDLYEELGDTEGLIWAIEGLAQLAGACDGAESATLLLGATRAAREAHELPLPLSDTTRYRELLQQLEEQLGSTAYVSASTRGGCLPLEQAIAVAQKVLERMPPNNQSDC